MPTSPVVVVVPVVVVPVVVVPVVVVPVVVVPVEVVPVFVVVPVVVEHGVWLMTRLLAVAPAGSVTEALVGVTPAARAVVSRL
jgi:hypothetical protein